MALIALFSLGLSEPAQAAENRGTPKWPNINVQQAGFGEVSGADIRAVLESAMSEILRHCPHARLSGITVYHRNDRPQTNFSRSSDGSVAIGLTAKGTYWAQYSFQFAHEFCHAVANFSNNPRQSVRHPKHANFWLEESLCETASLFTLRAMSRSWRNVSGLSSLAQLRTMAGGLCGGANQDPCPSASAEIVVLGMVPRE